MSTDEGGLDELGHRIAGDPSLSKVDDLAIAVSLHPDQVAERDHIRLNFFSAADGIGMTVLKIYGSGEAPGLSLSHQLVLQAIRRERRGHRWQDCAFSIHECVHR